MKNMGIGQNSSTLKSAADRDVIAAEITPRGLKNSPRADYFQSKQTGLWGVFVEAERDDGREDWTGSRRHSSASAEVFLRIKATKLDSGKAVLTSVRLKPCCCYPRPFLGTETESFRGRHFDNANRFLRKVKFNKELQYVFLIKEEGAYCLKCF